MKNEPLVSILIPTYNRPDFFRDALGSALGQTYQNLEIIVSDDGTDDRTESFVRENVHDPRVTYIHQPFTDALQNGHWLLTHFHGDYFNLLMDDDMIAATKIETMVACYQAYPAVSLVTSYRRIIDSEGHVLPDTPATEKITDEPTIFRGAELKRMVLERMTNFIGEPSTVLLRREAAEVYLSFAKEYHPNSDILTWLHLMERGDVIYLPDPLSFFRQHEGQAQRRAFVFFCCVCDWLETYLNEVERTQATDDKELLDLCWKKYCNVTCDLVTKFWPATCAALHSESFDSDAQIKFLAIEERYHHILAEYERILFTMK